MADRASSTNAGPSEPHRLLRLVDSANVKSDAVDKGSTQKEKKKIYP